MHTGVCRQLYSHVVARRTAMNSIQPLAVARRSIFTHCHRKGAEDGSARGRKKDFFLSSRTLGARYLRWPTREHLDGCEPTEPQEELAKADILEKVMKGRQPSDLMLRCMSRLSLSCPCAERISSGTVLDAEGNTNLLYGLLSF